MPKCRICNKFISNSLISMEFREKKFLPEMVDVFFCKYCDFVFNHPVNQADYANYYRSNKNDQISSAKNFDLRVNSQVEILFPYLDNAASLNVIDVGCGNGDLLFALEDKFPQHNFIGVDYNTDRERSGGVLIVDNLASLDASMRFDLVIMSHTLEHIVDFSDFEEVVYKLNENGIVYIEVPDAMRYAEMPRREYLYYFDRLHVNHFSLKSLCRLSSLFGVDVFDHGPIEFDYKDGRLYPALFVIASRLKGTTSVGHEDRGLDLAIREYLNSENDRFLEFRDKWSSKEVLVYGFGDNFFRAHGSHGPLSLANIVGVMDRDWRSLSLSSYASRFNFCSLESALESHQDLPVFVTMSWGGEQIVEDLTSRGFKSVMLL